MSTITPPIFTHVHQEETEHKRAIAEEVIRKLLRNNNFLIDLAPVGTIIFVNTNQLGGGQPSSTYWQICDGAEITNPNSPLRSVGLNLRFTPNLKGLYPRGAEFSNTNPNYGTHQHNLQHAHDTGGANTDGGGLRKKGDRNRRNPHGHVLFSQYASADDGGTLIEAPAFCFLVAYLKIV